eukprot:gene10013-2332_t
MSENETQVIQPTIKCDGCQKLHTSYNTLKSCSYCRKAFYCTKICQGIDWPKHKLKCKKQAFFKRVDSITKYFFGKYEWIISNNIHAHFTYSLILEKGLVPTFKFTKQNRVQNVQEFREYKGTWFPISTLKDPPIDFEENPEDIFKENTSFRLKLQCTQFQKETEIISCDNEFMIQFERLLTSPEFNFRVITKPFKIFNDSRVILSGIPNELFKFNLQKEIQQKLDIKHFIDKFEFELDYYHSTDEAFHSIFTTVDESNKFGLIEIVNEFLKNENFESAFYSLFALLKSWIEIACSMEDRNNFYTKTYEKLSEKFIGFLEKIKENNQEELKHFWKENDSIKSSEYILKMIQEKK